MTQAFRVAVVAGVAMAATLFPVTTATAQQALNFGTSSIGSVFYVISIAMSKMIGKHGGINVTVQPVGGSYPNLFALADKKVDLAMANSLSHYERFHGKAPFKEPFEIRMIAQGQPNFRVIIVREAAGITRVEDLAGKTLIGQRRALPELAMITDALLKAHGLARSGVRVIETVDTGQVAKAFKAGTVDAAIYPAALRQPLLTSLFQESGVRFIDLAKDKQEAMLTLLPQAFYPATLPAGSFPGQEKPAHVFGLYTSLVTSADLSDDVVYTVIRSVLGHPEEFATYHAAARQWTIEQSLAHPSIPFHPGAIRFFKEAGKWTAELDRVQERLLKRQ